MTRRAAIACGEHFVVRKWMGGTLTNSDGVLGLSARADLVVMLSMPVLQSALRDTNQLCIPTIGITDTDCDPTKVRVGWSLA
jgi:ribosomal protein S2